MVIPEYRSGDYACTAYVTFKDAYAQETACLLSVSIYQTCVQNTCYVETRLILYSTSH